MYKYEYTQTHTLQKYFPWRKGKRTGSSMKLARGMQKMVFFKVNYKGQERYHELKPDQNGIKLNLM